MEKSLNHNEEKRSYEGTFSFIRIMIIERLYNSVLICDNHIKVDWLIIWMDWLVSFDVDHVQKETVVEFITIKKQYLVSFSL